MFWTLCDAQWPPKHLPSRAIGTTVFKLFKFQSGGGEVPYTFFTLTFLFTLTLLLLYSSSSPDCQHVSGWMNELINSVILKSLLFFSRHYIISHLFISENKASVLKQKWMTELNSHEAKASQSIHLLTGWWRRGSEQIIHHYTHLCVHLENTSLSMRSDLLVSESPWWMVTFCTLYRPTNSCAYLRLWPQAALNKSRKILPVWFSYFYTSLDDIL